MNTHSAGHPVGSGLYVSFRNWDLQIVSGDDEAVEMGEGYRRIPLLMLVVLSPVIGGVYAMAFPAIIFGAFLRAIREQVGQWRLYTSGERVGWGVYVGLNRLCVSYVSASDEVLEGERATRFARVPTWLVILGSPLIGLLYVILFPFLLGAALFTVLLSLVVAPFRRVTERYSTLTTSRWEPSAAYLDKPEAEAEASEVEATEPSEEDPFADLTEEVEARRKDEAGRQS